MCKENDKSGEEKAMEMAESLLGDTRAQKINVMASYSARFEVLQDKDKYLEYLKEMQHILCEEIKHETREDFLTTWIPYAFETLEFLDVVRIARALLSVDEALVGHIPEFIAFNNREQSARYSVLSCFYNNDREGVNKILNKVFVETPEGDPESSDNYNYLAMYYSSVCALMASIVEETITAFMELSSCENIEKSTELDALEPPEDALLN